MADTGILFRRGLKLNLIVDPPLVGEIVYAIDTNEHGWLEVDTNGDAQLKWGNLVNKGAFKEGATLRSGVKEDFISYTENNLSAKVVPGEIVFGTNTNEHGWINANGDLIWIDLSAIRIVQGSSVTLNTSLFNGNLDITDTNVQKAMSKLDGLVSLSSAAIGTSVISGNFTKNLDTSNNTVQKALDAIDSLVIGAQSPLNIATFGGLLSNTDIDIQTAFNTLSATVIPSNAGDLKLDTSAFSKNLNGMDADATIQEAIAIVDGLIFEYPIYTTAYTGNIPIGTGETTVQELGNIVDALHLGEVNEVWSSLEFDALNDGKSVLLKSDNTLQKIFNKVDSLDIKDKLVGAGYTGNLYNNGDGSLTVDTLQKLADKYDAYRPSFQHKDGTKILPVTYSSLEELATAVDNLALGELNESYGSVAFTGNLTGSTTLESIFVAIDTLNFTDSIDSAAFAGNLTVSDDNIQKVAAKVDTLALGELNESYGSVAFTDKLSGSTTLESIFVAIDGFNFADPIDASNNVILPTTISNLQSFNDSVESSLTIDNSNFVNKLSGSAVTTIQSLANFIDILPDQTINASGFSRNLTSTDNNLQAVSNIVDNMPIVTKDVTTNRNLTPSIGDVHFDTTLNKPTWYDGVEWVDANGTIV